MHTNWYQVKIKYQQVIEDDKVKNITEAFLFDAVSYTDAETRGYDYLAGGKPQFELTAITKMKLAEVFIQDNDAEVWFKCRVQYIIFDEKTKQEKKTAVVMLINANSVKEAYEALEQRLGTVEDYIISDINATKILEVIPYEQMDQKRVEQGNFRPLAEVEAEAAQMAQAEPAAPAPAADENETSTEE
ncbi:DUF4494 domain-containing protein [Jiulongibacter sp. NS-SX5]|uniref:DUF4494 domain-containing protein n=1 Tax=Jiulongibacter sp. NS-SX5 TaxID=3463854 RepID=UPI0040590A1E